MIKKLNSDLCHFQLAQKAERKLAYNEEKDYDTWREDVRAKAFELLGMASMENNVCPLNVEIEEDVAMDGYRRIRFTFDSETGCTVPCYLLIPDTGRETYPLAITLQGHSSGFHNSIGEPKYPGDEAYLEKYGPFGLQAVENGFAALCIEQRGMGEQRSPLYPGPGGVHACAVTSIMAINLGRTVLGERVWDIHRAIDALTQLAMPQVDLNKIVCTGNSGGATATYYAACYDERIAVAVPSCGFCAYEASIMKYHHCVCNYIPGVCRWLEMEDFACLIAPRPMSFFTGRLDPDFPVSGVESAFETVKKIYAKAGAPDQCRLTVTPKGHFWCRELVWPEIRRMTEELGW